ncbi:MAG: GDSL-type esterase/lipase family protein [Clostridiales bacterium]|nr:GDSL-type esterase/lipase family protein [Clostridiales bacterium]
MKMKQRFLSLMLTVILCVSMIPSIAFAESTTPYYLALGDSITTGYGLDDASTECFTVLLADQIGAELENKVADGYTSEDVLADLESGDLDSSIASADLITITLGGNDLMDVFYQSVADVYNDTYNDDMTVEDIKEVLASPTSNLTVAMRLLNIVNSDDFVEYLESSEDLVQATETFTDNLKAIISYLRTENASNVILVETQYNPYLWIGDDYANITAAFQVGVDALNNAIIGAASSGFTVADVATAFANSEENLCNADSSLSSLNFDFHPNADGHKVIAEVMADAYENAAAQSDPQDDTEDNNSSDSQGDSQDNNNDNTEDDSQDDTQDSSQNTNNDSQNDAQNSSQDTSNDTQDDSQSNTSGKTEKSIKLNKSTAKMYTGSKLTLTATVTGISGNVTFSSSNTKVATVTQKGVVKAKKPVQQRSRLR